MKEKAKVTISGSYRKHFDRISEARQAFILLDAEVLRPDSEVIIADEEVPRLEGDPDSPEEIHAAQLKAIEACDLLYVVNPGGYVGPAATFEVGYAHRGGKTIVTAEVAFEPVVAAVSRVGDPEAALEALSARIH